MVISSNGDRSTTSPEIPQFVCSRCGNCCRNMIDADQAHLNFPRFVNMDPSATIIQMNPASLPLYDFEIRRFPPNQVVPRYIVFDRQNNQTLVLDYTISSQNCPHLTDNNLCTIYDNRPTVCGAFPTPYGGVEDVGGKFMTHAEICPSELESKELHELLGMDTSYLQRESEDTSSKLQGDPHVNDKTLMRNSFLRYRKSFILKFMRLSVASVTMDFLEWLEEQQHIKLARPGYNMASLAKKIQKSPLVAVSDFLESHRQPRLESLFTQKVNKETEREFSSMLDQI